MILLMIRYSPEQLFDVVAAVDLYHGFVPWCQRSDIIKRYPDGSFDAELEIGFKFLVESYVSHVELSRAKFVKVIIMLTLYLKQLVFLLLSFYFVFWELLLIFTLPCYCIKILHLDAGRCLNMLNA